MDDLLVQLRDLSADNRMHALAALGVAGSSAATVGGGSSQQHSSRSRDSFFYRKLRLFSGKVPVPNGEVDYVSWRMQVRQIEKEEDDRLSEAQLKRLIMQSLQRPALDSLRNTSGSVSEILTVLDTLYESVEDGQELLIKFFTTYQQEKEAASAYLQRIYLQVMDVADKGGIKVSEVSGYLVRQFVRGSHDDTLIQKLGLDDTEDSIPGFAELLLAIRKEEARRTEKRLRLKVGRVATQTSSPVKPPNTERALQSEDKQQIAELTSRLEVMEIMLQQHHVPSPSHGHSESWRKQSPEAAATGREPSLGSGGSRWKNKRTRRRTQFCYKCGLDGHYADKCTADKNPELVQQKLLGSEN